MSGFTLGSITTSYSNPVQVSAKIKRTAFKEFVIVLAKLRLNSLLQDFAYILNISVATVSRI